jgi:hypothetical protein
MMRPLAPYRRVRYMGLGICGLFVLIVLALWLTERIGVPVQYRIAGEYRGWVGIRYADEACPPMQAAGLYLVIVVGPDGRSCTSSEMPGGWRYSRYVYVYPDGRSRALSGAREDVVVVGSTGPAKPYVETLFIGSDEELKRSWARRNDFVREMLGTRQR